MGQAGQTIVSEAFLAHRFETGEDLDEVILQVAKQESESVSDRMGVEGSTQPALN